MQLDTNPTPVIRVHELEKVYRRGTSRVKALRGIDLEVWPGEFVAIMGPSGFGKSTFMNVIGCLDLPSGGLYVLDGMEVTRLGRPAGAVT